jgi:hypothetical protein
VAQVRRKKKQIMTKEKHEENKQSQAFTDVFHPVEPFQVRAGLTARFYTAAHK